MRKHMVVVEGVVDVKGVAIMAVLVVADNVYLFLSSTSLISLPKCIYNCFRSNNNLLTSNKVVAVLVSS